MKKKRAGFGMREKLMLAMCGISFLVLGVLRFATTSLLQPTYNHFIYESWSSGWMPLPPCLTKPTRTGRRSAGGTCLACS